jgi:hypothetical protein
VPHTTEEGRVHVQANSQVGGWNFGTDPDPRIRTSDLRIRIRTKIFSYI